MKMRMFYSAATGGFYCRSVHAQIPDDAVPVTPARHRALLAGQAAGAAIVAGKGGRPALRRPAPPSSDDRRRRLTDAALREGDRRAARIASPGLRTTDAVTIARHALDVAAGGAADAPAAALARADAVLLVATAVAHLIDRIAAAPVAALAAIDPAAEEHWP